MTWWFAALLGVVQGLTEFLPVSSTAHLRVVPALLERPDPGAAFTAVLQLGTLVAVVLFFARELGGMTRQLAVGDWRGKQARLALLVVLGTIPIGIAGILFKPFVVGEARSLYVVATALIVVGGILFVADRRSTKHRTVDDLRVADALWIGAAQALALVPGVSRSGATLAAALFLGCRRDAAARFSFLLSIPAIAAAGVFELPDVARELGREAWPAVLVGTVVAGITGYASIAWLLRHLERRSLAPFVIYRLALGVLVWGLLSAGLLN
jgi:undecaprenyl-diphosphatase